MSQVAVILGTVGLSAVSWFAAYKAWDLLLKREETSGKLWAIILILLLFGILMSVVASKAVFDAQTPEKLAVVNKTNVSANTTHLDYAVVSGESTHNTGSQAYYLALGFLSFAVVMFIVHVITAWWEHIKDVSSRGRGGSGR
jgi:apolipoprotein N-acyltransferase